MAEIANRKVAIDLNIRTVHLKVEEPMEVYIEWQRGGKHIDTKVKDIDPSQPTAIFNEKFQMKTVLEYDIANQTFLNKKSVLALFRKKDKALLGKTDFDLSIYANKPKPTGDKLFLSECSSEGAYIEIFIKATETLPDGTTPASSRMSAKTLKSNSEADTLKFEEQEKAKQLLHSQIAHARLELLTLQEQNRQTKEEHESLSRIAVKSFEEMVHEREERIREIDAQIKEELQRQEIAEKQVEAYDNIREIVGSQKITPYDVSKQIAALNQEIAMLLRDRDYSQKILEDLYAVC